MQGSANPFAGQAFGVSPQSASGLPPSSGAGGGDAAPAPGWGIGTLIAGVLLYLLVATVAGVGLLLVRRPALVPAADLRSLLEGLFGLLSEALLALPVWLLVVVRRKGSWATVGFRRVGVVLGLALPVAYLLVAFTGEALWGAVIHYMNWPTQQSIENIFGGSTAGVVLGFLTVSIVAPIAEETFFRGFVIGGLRKRFGTVGALVISALLFMLPHPPVTIYPIIFGLGILLGLLYLQTNSLWPGILLHAMFNTVAFVAQFYINQSP